VISDLTETAIRQHYIRTPTYPSDMEYAMIRHSDYVWERGGEDICEVISELLEAGTSIAKDIQELLEEKNSDFDMMAMGEEPDFASDSQYTESTVQDTRDLDTLWEQFVRSLKTVSRYINPTVTKTLDGIFIGIEQMKGRNGQPVIMVAGPDTDLSSLYRARYSTGLENMDQMLIEPDRELGPPPHRLSGANRMSAKGISVFYGASSVDTAISEIRPPVGSNVISARFNLIRPLRLLNLPVLENVWLEGSKLDPKFIGKCEQIAFLRKLTSRLVIPVLPGQEDFDYIPTQVIAEYLADDTGMALDGMLYPSVQQSEEISPKHFNVVLFHKASGMQYLELPPKKHCSVRYGHPCSEDEWEPDICVTNIIDPCEEPDIQVPDLSSNDMRQPALQIELSSICVHHIQVARFKYSSQPVRRDTDILQPSFLYQGPDNASELSNDIPF
jgi:hypothetical protein